MLVMELCVWSNHVSFFLGGWCSAFLSVISSLWRSGMGAMDGMKSNVWGDFQRIIICFLWPGLFLRGFFHWGMIVLKRCVWISSVNSFVNPCVHYPRGESMISILTDVLTMLWPCGVCGDGCLCYLRLRPVYVIGSSHRPVSLSLCPWVSRTRLALLECPRTMRLNLVTRQ